MACYYPVKGYRSLEKTKNGKRKIVFNPKHGYVDLPITVPCMKCVGCRIDHTRDWAIRCVHEASLYENNCFITLTYRDKDLPLDGSLNLIHFQKFMKKYRKKFGSKIRFYHCGEYGPKLGRPHYHACIFNHTFEDKQFFKTLNGQDLYTSPSLEKLWPHGFSTIGDLTFESAAYVARYIMKKISGEKAQQHYETVNCHTGEISQLTPEYTTMSRMPGIGHDWFIQYSGDIYPKDFVTHKGKKYKPPKYYDTLHAETHSEQMEEIKGKRKQKANQQKEDQTFERLIVRETVKKAQLLKLIRPYESGEIE